VLKNIVWLKLDKESHLKLLEAIKPKFSKIDCDHITLDWNTDLEYWKKIQGRKYELEVIKITNDEFIQAIPVDLETIEVKSINKIPHITVSYQPQTHPFHSNTMLHLAEQYTDFSPTRINVEVLIFDYESK
jgi:Fungal tRNA ligase phosphodiesterase domain